MTEQARRLALFVPSHEAESRLAAAAEELRESERDFGVEDIAENRVVISAASKEEARLFRRVHQVAIVRHLGVYDVDKSTVLAHGDDLVRYPITTARYTLGWTSPTGIADVLADIRRQQMESAQERLDYVKIIDAHQLEKGQDPWESQFYIQSFYSTTSGSESDEGFWIEVRNGTAATHFGLGGVSLSAAIEIFRDWLGGQRNLSDHGDWTQLVL